MSLVDHLALAFMVTTYIVLSLLTIVFLASERHFKRKKAREDKHEGRSKELWPLHDAATGLPFGSKGGPIRTISSSDRFLLPYDTPIYDRLRAFEVRKKQYFEGVERHNRV